MSRNRTITLTDADRAEARRQVVTEVPLDPLPKPPEGIVHGDQELWVPKLPHRTVDLLFLDPPYNLTKSFRGKVFSRRSVDMYTNWLGRLLVTVGPLLKPEATVYICGDWYTSTSIFQAVADQLVVRNRITWQREKGRGARSNWKNCSEDIWFCTVGANYTFNVGTVKQRRQVVAPYRTANGKPKDWKQTSIGRFRDTHPSNLWDDITIPFWSMPENTEHPTQKSEKLLAKLVLASTNPGDYILDPFLGSGTTTAVARKLGRRALGIEIEEEYALIAAHRLKRAQEDTRIQGYTDGVFWERNTAAAQKGTEPAQVFQPKLFTTD